MTQITKDQIEILFFLAQCEAHWVVETNLGCRIITSVSSLTLISQTCCSITVAMSFKSLDALLTTMEFSWTQLRTSGSRAICL